MLRKCIALLLFSLLILSNNASGLNQESGRLYPILKDDKYGYTDKTGKVVIEPKFDTANDFSDGVACVELGKLFGYIDKTGSFIIEPQYKWAGNFSEGLAPVSIDDNMAYINKSGTIVIKPMRRGLPMRV